MEAFSSTSSVSASFLFFEDLSDEAMANVFDEIGISAKGTMLEAWSSNVAYAAQSSKVLL
jgi:hypothetical protein